MYLACVIDICSRRVPGWSTATHMRTEPVVDALEMAVATRGGHVDGVIFHADRARSTHRPRSRRFATVSGSAGAWAGSARATSVSLFAPGPRENAVIA
ncbi:DDE-type integrase/transposase/recombinase [Streptomyces sp. NPDC005017]|uniref:DDE-type integrase/transposase/recombinase n=1 Tax=Streptomyces sp. NPDC005017 TaxID=3364706 RepID=UPI0036BC534A